MKVICFLNVMQDAMEVYRQTCELGAFLQVHKTMQPSISALKLAALYLKDNNSSNSSSIKGKALTLYHMKRGWHHLMNID